MNRRILFVASFLLLPGIASAQRASTASRARNRDAADVLKDDATPKGPTLRPRDLEDMSPIKLLIDKRKDLKLSDAQVNALKDSENTLKKQNESLMQTVDSLVREMRPPLNETTESKIKIQSARADLTTTLDALTASYDAPVKAALAGFDADQQKKAGELMDKQKEEGQKMLREKLGGGGGRRG